MRRWTHGHTLAVGGLAGFAMATHLWWVSLGAFALGFLAGNLWHRAREAARWAARKAVELHDARVQTELARAAGLRDKARPRAVQDAELKRAYIQGATDQLHQLQP